MAYRHNFSGMNEFSWDDGVEEMEMFDGFPADFGNNRYSEAYGDYRGGYAPRRPPMGFGFGFMPGPRPGAPFFRPPPPPLMMGRGRGFGPRGPPPKRFAFDDRAIKYLLRCGVPKENLKNLPKELLQLIEPEHCGLCGQTFESFTSSRIHYVSKNHLKSQKKWLALKLDKGGTTKESPLKARELYCELCDVHITSTQHAESHYAGKPHRAIVEGRRLPKNAMLLQKNLEDRLEQLIRREKKHLKASPEGTETKSNEAGQDKKTIQPDLHCDICKTSVTCTEQMTMHLNGKKHLNKEKQHILNMMKGEKVDKNGDESDGAAGATDGTTGSASATMAEDNQDYTKDSYDWGNGSGAWE